MSIQVAQAVIRNNDTDNIPKALEEIQEAIRDGYILCRVDEAVERMNSKRKEYLDQLSGYVGIPEQSSWQTFYARGFKDSIKIVKECCG